ncbi:MAG TPA: twin-arginine translocase TatA/TatE family subunit [Solirubrobacteraceae bacterium]
MASGILSPTHLLVVLVVALIVLGPKRLPGAGKALGQGLKEFKDSIGGSGPSEETAQIPAAPTMMQAPAVPANESAPVHAGEMA